MSGNVDERLLGRWRESQRRQEAMRGHLARSALRVENFEGRTLDLLADAFVSPDAGQPRLPPAGTGALMSDDR